MPNESIMYELVLSKLYTSVPARPFERTASENDEIFKAAQQFDQLTCQVDDTVLKELCVVAQLDVWKEQDITCEYCLHAYIHTHIYTYIHILKSTCTSLNLDFLEAAVKFNT